MDMNDVTIGLKTFFRTDKLEKCLRSIEQSPYEFREVIVADDGKSNSKKEEIYEEYRDKLPLEVLDLEFDYGLAASRNEIVDEMSGKYLLLMDDDMTLPGSVDTLKRTLKSEESLGAVSGMLYENGEFRAGAHNFRIRENIFGRTLVRDMQGAESIDVETEIGEKKVHLFDFIPTCSLIRKEVLEDQKWDPEYIIEMEHIDFFLSHKQNTEWKFGLTEEVIFPHYPGGSPDYEEHRDNDNKIEDSYQYFLDKWELDRMVWEDKFIYQDKGCQRTIKNKIKDIIPPELNHVRNKLKGRRK